MHVLGSAGHVDHGKSSLLRVLTGMEPSRHEEERRRGMTIELGFVWHTLADGTPLGIVDVPGHKDFRATMISGATGIDGFLFCVAADDGWMPQSEDHARILAALGVHHGLVVLTKVDLVDSDRRQQVTDEIRARLRQIFPRPLPLIPFSSITGEGHEAIKTALEELNREIPPAIPEDESAFFVADRQFAVKGQGTVVTGTLRRGKLSRGQTLELLPSGHTPVIREIHSYKRSVPEALACTRAALLLSNLSTEDRKLDPQFALSGEAKTSSTLDVHLTRFPNAPRPRARQSREVLLVHAGAKCPARLVSLTTSDPSAETARIHLFTPRWIRFGDPIMILTSGGDHLIAIARAANPSPPRRSRLTQALALIASLHEYTPASFLHLKTSEARFVSLEEVARLSPWKVDVLRRVALGDPSLRHLGPWITRADKYPSLTDTILTLIQDHLASNAAQKCVPLSWISRRVGIPASPLALVLDQLVSEGTLARHDGGYLPPSRTRVWSATERPVIDSLTRALEDPTPHAWTLEELGLDHHDGRRLLRALLDDQLGIRLSDRHFMGITVFNTLKDRVRSHLDHHAPLSTAALRDHLGLGRKLVILVLETLDRLGATRRKGDMRS